ncbi:MAG: glycosyltransferase [Proteobacteria bacterium]|nr:glycosyltransferase [Pseudomonadota bacterium]
MNITIVTDAWKPQVNGVVRNYESLTKVFRERGNKVTFISPLDFMTVPCPTYPEISLAIFPKRKLVKLLEASNPERIHIATEGPLGWAARAYCIKNGLPFTTCYHTKFPEYIHERFSIPLDWSYGLMRKFHDAATTTLINTDGVYDELTLRRFNHLRKRRMGVDGRIFQQGEKDFLKHLPRPIFVCHGRIAVEKNLEAFLKLDLPGTKLVIGPGPLLPYLKKKYPDVVFTGYVPDEEMSKMLAASDVMVFPSFTETFGLVQLEAMACGLPVAALPVTGPNEIVGKSGAGVLDTDLRKAALAALDINGDTCRKHALQFKWEDGADDFLGALTPLAKSA